ncbi:hypothetical protein F2Q70_00042995 [Brassica cretica]|uniref:Uncharacterized protein n=1 Tax=Brassica cretica TaxID=69181 RepID=A0A8S9KMW9_BRACR|nr:hypothetical protein F2Q70_00042995 [Brassica cretica]
MTVELLVVDETEKKDPIIFLFQVVRCCLEHAASVARHSRCQTVLLLRSRNLSQFQQATQWTTQVCSDISLNLR